MQQLKNDVFSPMLLAHAARAEKSRIIRARGPWAYEFELTEKSNLAAFIKTWWGEWERNTKNILDARNAKQRELHLEVLEHSILTRAAKAGKLKYKKRAREKGEMDGFVA